MQKRCNALKGGVVLSYEGAVHCPSTLCVPPIDLICSSVVDTVDRPWRGHHLVWVALECRTSTLLKSVEVGVQDSALLSALLLVVMQQGGHPSQLLSAVCTGAAVDETNVPAGIRNRVNGLPARSFGHRETIRKPPKAPFTLTSS